ncbi:glycosyltransferase [uncultured Maribacter sp.]|uniref:glycosyltransferase n=1 Tax=uncultured Maribacter sp. TaxID=431308 RepID=UPI002636E767|nr:glycosyltransferase [uncultured Maribacter sp.]
MNISFVLDSFGGGGKERRCLQLIQGLNKQDGFNIQVIIVNNDVSYPELYETNIDLQIIDSKKRKLNIVQTSLFLYRLLKDFNPDIVQAWGVFSSFFINPISCFLPFKYIGAYVANCNKPKKLSYERFTVLINTWLADCIIGNSEAGIKAYGIPKRKAKVIYNGFNEERYAVTETTRSELKQQMGIQAKFVIAMIARVDINKDYETYIRAAKLILEQKSDILFLIVGSGPNLIPLQSLISDNEKKYFNFLGFRSDIEKILRITDVSVLCTNPQKHKEGVSNSIMESLAFGVPVIATNDGGTPEIIESGINGFLINAYDSKELKDKILQLIDDEMLIKKISDTAKLTIETKFNLNLMTSKYIDLYKSLLGKS